MDDWLQGKVRTMNIIIANPIKRISKWVLMTLVLIAVLLALAWGVHEWIKPCPNCHGKTLQCPDCHGEGFVVKVKDCPKCRGSGKGRVFGKCSACNGAKITTYRETCEKCNGNRIIACPTCHKLP